MDAGDGAFLLGVLHGEPEEGREEAVHERRIGLHRLLAGRAAEVGGLEEVDVLGEVLSQELEPEPAPALRTIGRRALEAPLRLRLDAAQATEQVRRHVANLHGRAPDCQTWRPRPRMDTMSPNAKALARPLWIR